MVTTLQLLEPKRISCGTKMVWKRSSNMKRRGLIGFAEGCVRDMRILNRIVRLFDDGLRYEADPRHAEMMGKGHELDFSKYGVDARRTGAIGPGQYRCRTYP